MKIKQPSKAAQVGEIPAIHNMHTKYVSVNAKAKASQIGSDFKGELAKEYFGGKEALFGQSDQNITFNLGGSRAQLLESRKESV